MSYAVGDLEKVRPQIKISFATLAFVLAFSSSVFGQPIQKIWETALDVDPILTAKKERIVAAEHNMIASEAEKLGKIDIYSRYRWQNDNQTRTPNDPIIGNLPLTQKDNYSGSLAYQRTIYDFGKIKGTIDASFLAHQSAIHEYYASVQSLKLNVAKSYINILRADDSVAIAKAKLESLQEHRDKVNAKYRQGRAIINEVLSINAAVSNTEIDIVKEEANVKIAKAHLNRFLQRRLEEPMQIEHFELPPDERDMVTLAQRAILIRTELQVLSAEASKLTRQADSVDASRKPQISARLGVDAEQNRYLANQAFSSAAILADWNVSDFGKRRNEACSLRRQASAVLSERIDIVSRIEFEVYEASTRQGSTRQAIELRKAAVEAAEENLRVQKSRYREGKSSTQNVLEAEAILVNAQTQYSLSKFDAILATMELLRATGEL